MSLPAFEAKKPSLSFATLADKIFEDNILTQAAALGFYTALAISPLLGLLVTLLSTLKLKWHEQLLIEVQELMGADAAKVVELIINHTSNFGNINIWGFVFLGISASAIFAQLQTAMNIIFKSQKPSSQTVNFWTNLQHFLIKRLICLGMVLTFVLLSIGTLAISLLLNIFSHGELKIWIKLLGGVGDFAVYIFLIAIIFKWMPDRPVNWYAAIRGGVLTAIMFLLGKIVIGLYLSQIAIGSTYGVMGSFVALLVWLYYSALIFLVGAEISALL